MAEQLRGSFETFVDSHYSKKRPSPPLHKVPVRSNEVSPRTLQTALIWLTCNRHYVLFWTWHRGFNLRSCVAGISEIWYWKVYTKCCQASLIFSHIGPTWRAGIAQSLWWLCCRLDSGSILGGDRDVFSSPPLWPYQLWGPPSLLSSGYQGSFSGGKPRGSWSWPVVSTYCRG
jgi:hypothetical protein